MEGLSDGTAMFIGPERRERGVVSNYAAAESKRRIECVERQLRAALEQGWKMEELEIVSVDRGRFDHRYAVVPKTIMDRLPE